MKKDHRDALVLFLERSVREPGAGERWSFVNATPLPQISSAWKAALLCQQDFRPDFLQLQKAGFSVSTDLPPIDETFKGVVFIPSRSRRWNEAILARLWNKMMPEQTLVVAGEKNSGIASLRKWIAGFVEITESFSKHHAVVFSVVREPQSPLLPHTDIDKRVEGYHLREGVFSADGPDAGSSLLVDYMDDRIRGRVADLGAGWGYLSSKVIERSTSLRALDLFEASLPALDLARKNLAGTNIPIAFNWLDITSEFQKTPYDWVIMNPPFHAGRAADPDIGKRFIEVAASTLPAGGRLLMVANRNLPYEKTLETRFRRFETIADLRGFKILEAVK
ncbi:MAG: class I SAM-dependent methyltransferase [Pseudomonadota bacterium]